MEERDEDLNFDEDENEARDEDMEDINENGYDNYIDNE